MAASDHRLTLIYRLLLVGRPQKTNEAMLMPGKSQAPPPSPFRYFNSSPEVIRLVVMMYVRLPSSLRNVEDLLFERGIDICHKTVRMAHLRPSPPTATLIPGSNDRAWK